MVTLRPGKRSNTPAKIISPTERRTQWSWVDEYAAASGLVHSPVKMLRWPGPAQVAAMWKASGAPRSWAAAHSRS